MCPVNLKDIFGCIPVYLPAGIKNFNFSVNNSTPCAYLYIISLLIKNNKKIV